MKKLKKSKILFATNGPFGRITITKIGKKVFKKVEKLPTVWVAKNGHGNIQFFTTEKVAKIWALDWEYIYGCRVWVSKEPIIKEYVKHQDIPNDFNRTLANSPCPECKRVKNFKQRNWFNPDLHIDISQNLLNLNN